MKARSTHPLGECQPERVADKNCLCVSVWKVSDNREGGGEMPLGIIEPLG